ncbi:SusD/RagB family nutrient-binding outer membrane lipoprotein [Pontibacter kalidii]|uniref:SusD/RagB family nutrient-binding outer membrane lipoprotein n=1 Tax=Pontibacter kalidii TaxID=2592049 RepID=UPI002257C404|nr:SusD/RagB family nutrient-binding outer membrane lipoprotein [Pontibacter kalidii]
MKKRFIYLALGLVLAQGFTACETVDFGDINENPNGPNDPYPAGLLSGAIQSFATMTGRQGVLNPTLYVQYQSQVTYTDEMLYAETPASWATYYNRVLPNLNAVIDIARDEAQHTPELLAQGDPNLQLGEALIFRAIVLKRLTDTWGDAPFTDAFKGLDNLTPAYDTQEQIYTQLIADLQEGRDLLAEGGDVAPIGDILYDGNLDNWQKLANSVLMQAALQLSEVDATSSIDAVAVFNEALNHPAGAIEKIEEEAWFRYESLTAYQNPFNRNRRADYFLADEFVDALQGDPMTAEGSLNPTSNKTFDARIKVYGTSATAEGVPYGYNDESGTGRNKMSTIIWAAEAPLPVMTAAYTYLNRAEAAARGWTDEVAADMLAEGIQMSFATWDEKAGAKVDFRPEEISTYVAARLLDATTVGMLQVIGEEKWKALYPQGFDAWAEWRRTGYPALNPAEDALNDGAIARRYNYPVEEATLNNTNLQGGISGLAPATDKNTSRVWWDVE